MKPVAEEHPLSSCNHFIAAVPMEEGLPGPAHTIAGFYSRLGLALLGTVVDGDCGIDVACQMEGLPQTAEQRTLLREEPLGHFRWWKLLQRAVVSERVLTALIT